jgi:hypothetical protein
MLKMGPGSHYLSIAEVQDTVGCVCTGTEREHSCTVKQKKNRGEKNVAILNECMHRRAAWRCG